MTERERFIKTLRREPVPGHVPTFELVFFLTMEAFGRVHPSQRQYGQWKQMSAAERRLHLEDQADILLQTARKYHHSAIMLHVQPWEFDCIAEAAQYIREQSGDEFFLMLDLDPTFSIPNGSQMMAFTERLYENQSGLHSQAQRRMDDCLQFAEKMSRHPGLLDGFSMCADYCFNVNPFFSRDMFAQFIVPYLRQTIEAYHAMGYYAIKHTDGNIMPIIDMIADCGPDALHSLDPQGGVDLAQVSLAYGDTMALCGNVNCALLQTGTPAQCDADIRRSLQQGMQRGAGYIFCTSNCAYTGLPLERYERMIRIWQAEGVYGG